MPPNFVVGRCWRPLRASRREDWQVEHPGRGRDAPACHCHPTRAGGQGPARRREQGGQVRQAGANRRWPPPRAGASPAWRSVGGRWRGVRAPVPCAAPASVGRRAPSPLPLSGRATRSARARQGQGQRASRRGLPRGVSAGPAPPLPQGVARRTPTRAHGGRPAQQRGGELVEGRAQAHAHACLWDPASAYAWSYSPSHR